MAKLIELTNITKVYKTGSVDYEALRGISFSVNEGEMVAIMGPSGSGKSTIMHIIGALDTPTSGHYLLDGQDVSKLNDNKLAEIRNEKIGFVFQAFNLLPRTTVIDNVMLPLAYANVPVKERRVRAMNVLNEIEISHKAESRTNQISGGEIQRVAVARAIVTNPSIILADEPTGNLDTRRSIEVIQLFQKMNYEGRTIILITHELDIAESAKRIIHVKDGLIESDEINIKHRNFI